VRFAAAHWLVGAGFALVVAAILAWGGFLLLRATRRFGDEKLVLGLVTGRPGGRRALKGGLLVAAVALTFVALSEPQYGRGTRLVPATNLDVVVVLDYSKSMYARDIPPSRTLRAKSEVTRLMGDLPGARFGAVAFAGEPMAFPLTSDAGAIAQFFRQLTPNDMPVGGTAIARALGAARELFARDPLAQKHKKVIVLVTDGEDLEGDPVAVAQQAASEDIVVNVVQVGGRTPEPIPDVNEAGQVTGYRRDSEGKPLTTALSAEGEEQLAKVAQVSGGEIVRSSGGKTGIDVVAAKLRKLMTEELSERVETVYADVYYYPLGLAAVLLLIEVFVNETKPRARAAKLPPPEPKKRRRRRSAASALGASAGSVLALSLLLGCSRERSFFERNAPPVDEAIAALGANDAGAAANLLEQYLSTGKCDKGELGTPDTVRERVNASFDLGLALFKLGERFGQRFGQEAPPRDGGPSPEEQAQSEQRAAQVDCALRVVRLVAADATQAPEFRARALYLAGNLEFLRGDYRTAVKSYDEALKVIPGLPLDAGDPIGRDAAHNRAIALRRAQEEEDKKDAGPKDAGPDSGSPDSGPNDAGQDQKPASGPGEQDGGQPNAAPDAGGEKDAGPDAGQQNQPDPKKQDDDQQQQRPKPEPKSQNQQSQDEAILDQLEQAPSVQQQDAKNRALRARRGIGMEDK
jgi:Ca-activated chloride channel family protein